MAGLPSLVPAAGLKEVLDERKPRIVPDLNQERLRDAGIDPIYVELIRELGIESLMLLPLVARGRTLGVLTYASGESGRSFSPDALELAQGLAQRASLALDNAHMYDAARRAAAELSGLISIAPDAIITIDGDQRIVMYNEGAERIFGWKRADAIGKPVEVLMPERARATYRRHVHDLVAGPVAARSIGYRAISWGLRNDGTEFPVEAAISKLEIGEKRLFTVVLRDITERLRLEREREAAIAMRDDVMGIVAHDLRNPLATIATAVSVLKECSGDETLLKSGFVIERATRRMNRLIQDLLDVTRIEAGHLFIEPKQVSTQQAVLDCVDAQAQQITAASLVLDVQLSPDVVDVRADPDRLQQVLENLIGNAVKFSKAGGRVTVGARTSNQDVLFWVKDAGIGIAAEDVPHIFERFWQCGSQRRRGAGLGLTIVKGIVDAHGGRVWAESALGRGTTFFFTIPAEPTGEVGPGAPPRRR
ncbi:MAG: PAS domain S-box protein [Polyangiaceae bacterium]|nr:PAS domain S-box protein [Polyangiaceae bacterium]